MARWCRDGLVSWKEIEESGRWKTKASSKILDYHDEILVDVEDIVWADLAANVTVTINIEDLFSDPIYPRPFAHRFSRAPTT